MRGRFQGNISLGGFQTRYPKLKLRNEMFKITLLTTGKTKESWLNSALAEYTKRFRHSIEIQWRLAKDEPQLEEWVLAETHYIALDPAGKLFTSEELSSFLFKEWEKQGSSLNLVIGGAAGLSESMRKKAKALISLSPLTFTHQMTRLILFEQLYRCLEIRRGSPYHK